MARKNLGRFAALAGLAAMANRGGGGKGGVSERQIAADRDASAEPQSMEDDSGMDPMEAANKRTERTLTPNERGAAGTSETVTPTKRPVRTAPTPAASPATPASSSGTASAPDTGDETSRLANRYAKPPLRQETMRDRAESYNRKRGIPGYKSGGSVSSASRRGDGIATKGKTRGRMC